jgi:uncharacterized protein YecE (DUF72 family)
MARITQPDLFITASVKTANPVDPAPVRPEHDALARRLPPQLFLGTSSWSFPGWTGLVYRGRHDTAVLARHGLAAYARHPLLRTVSIDRSFYRPLSAEDYSRYAEDVPDGFRFVVKATRDLTEPAARGSKNPGYLDVERARRELVEPVLAGLGDKAGPVVFQFPPQGPSITRAPDRFADALYGFLRRLPEGPPYAVELRDAALLGEDLVAALATAGAGYCLSLHPRMPDIYEQMLIARQLPAAPLIVRWNLGHGLHYEQAKSRYAPFDRLQQEDLETRTALASAALRVLGEDQPVFVTINNKAEGCAPWSVIRLAQRIERGLRRAAA